MRERVQIKFGEYTPQAILDGKLNLLRDLDTDLESKIDTAYERMIAAEMDGAKLEYFHEMAGLVRQRSAIQIARMEVDRRIYRTRNRDISQ